MHKIPNGDESMIALRETVTANTPKGQLEGKVVGYETRDSSRHGGGEPVEFVCIRPHKGGAWIWVAADQVEVTP